MFNIIPLIFILISVSIIIVIVVKKFSILANLDVDNLQAEKEARFKEKMISNKVKRNFYKYFNGISKTIKPIAEVLKDVSDKSYKKLISYKEEKKEKFFHIKDELEEKNFIEKLFFDCNEFIKNNNLSEAEKILIKIIGFDSQNIDAFRKLGRLYFDKKNYLEAEQSFLHSLKLVENNLIDNQNNLMNDDRKYEDLLAEIAYDLTVLYKEIKEFKKALKNIDKSLLSEPNNPRYLDLKLELSILDLNKNLSLQVYEKLKEVNPDNKKLEDFRKRIDLL